MDNSQDCKPFTKTKLKPIKTVEQMVTSYVVADILIDFRKELIQKEEKTIYIPELDSSLNISERAKEDYLKATKILKHNSQLLFICKIGIEDLFKYDFRKDPSVVVAGSNDTMHLQQIFGPRFSDLKNINLLDHTLNVFEEGIKNAINSGRASGMAMGVLGCLFHDFGKSTKIREKVLGTGMQRGYKAHAEVSELYIHDLLLNELYNLLKEDIITIDFIDSLSKIVKNHHPTNSKTREDLDISFVTKADHEARKKEYVELTRRK